MLAVYATYRCKDEQRPGRNLLAQLQPMYLQSGQIRELYQMHPIAETFGNHVHFGMLPIYNSDRRRVMGLPGA